MFASCCFKIIKVTLFLLNLCLLVCSTFSLALSIWTMVHPVSIGQAIAQLSDGNLPLGIEFWNGTKVLTISSWILFAYSLVMFMLSFIGAYAIISESRSAIITYATLLTIVLAVFILGVSFLILFKEVWILESKSIARNQMAHYYRGTLGNDLNTTAGLAELENDYSFGVDYFMIIYQCCGLDGPEDFDKENSLWIEKGKGSLVRPVACCVYNNRFFYANGRYDRYRMYVKDAACLDGQLQASSQFNKEGCLAKMSNFFNDKRKVLVITVCMMALLKFILVFFSSLLAWHLKTVDYLSYLK